MHLSSDCLPCVFRQILQLTGKASSSPVVQEKLLREMLASLSRFDWQQPPPEFARDQQLIINRHLGEVDLFQKEKDDSTELALRVWQKIQQHDFSRHDGFTTAVHLAIGGNIIDYGVDGDFQLQKAEKLLLESLDMPLSNEKIKRLRQAMEKAEKILYILDNCGEAVFDRLLIERFRDKITLGVRGKPILNDITRRELAASGLKGFEVVDTGDCTPGVSEKHTAPDFIQAMRDADLIVAKGQGNFESMEAWEAWKLPIIFLFRAKCPVVTNFLGGVESGSMQIISQNDHLFLPGCQQECAGQ